MSEPEQRLIHYLNTRIHPIFGDIYSKIDVRTFRLIVLSSLILIILFITIVASSFFCKKTYPRITEIENLNVEVEHTEILRGFIYFNNSFWASTNLKVDYKVDFYKGRINYENGGYSIEDLTPPYRLISESPSHYLILKNGDCYYIKRLENVD